MWLHKHSEIKADSYEVSPSLLNLITREQFGGSAMEDDSMHLHDFVEICDMQKFKNVESDVLKLKLFPFHLEEKLKSGCIPCHLVVLILGMI